ncbi:hypothetical protein B0H14DRAFT_2644522 [Mycena olivaceomarginata]|nr:hypothetical protein B0H14DRAFT_2644522 [Mycena olivaceomarginata]
MNLGRRQTLWEKCGGKERQGQRQGQWGEGRTRGGHGQLSTERKREPCAVVKWRAWSGGGSAGTGEGALAWARGKGRWRRRGGRGAGAGGARSPARSRSRGSSGPRRQRGNSRAAGSLEEVGRASARARAGSRACGWRGSTEMPAGHWQRGGEGAAHRGAGKKRALQEAGNAEGGGGGLKTRR